MADDDIIDDNNDFDVDYANHQVDQTAGNALDVSKLPKDVPEVLSSIKTKKGPITPRVEQEQTFVPNNPYTLNGSQVNYNSGLAGNGIEEKPGFFKTAASEFYDWNVTAQGLHAGYEKVEQPNAADDIPPADWTPKTDTEKFSNVRPEYLNYIFSATGPKDQSYRLQRVYSEQATDDTLANGSFAAKLVGGIAGALIDPVNLIPIVGWAKYGKVGAGFIKNAMRAAPGVAAYSVLSSAAKEADKVNDNMVDFMTDTFVSTAFGTALFGVGGVLGLSAEKMNLWNLRNFAKSTIDGIDFKFNMNDKGVIDGIKAVDTTGGNLSAAKVSFAQDFADSSFNRGGIFKLPYLGEAAVKLLGMPVFGSPLVRWLNSPSKVLNAVIDRVADHSILTKGTAAGEVAPDKFVGLMNQTMAKLRANAVQMNALHLERNGFDIKNRPLNGLVNVGLNLRDKSLKLLGKDIDEKGYVSREDFDSEVQEVLSTTQPSEHAPVNTAASLQRKAMDDAYSRFREAYNLPKDWLPPRTQEGFLTRVYDTPYMNTNEDKWTNTIANWLADADKTIQDYTQPITDWDEDIKEHTEAHRILIDRQNVSDAEIKASSDELMGKKAARKSLIEKMQNDIRTNPDMNLHVEDWTALSADEAKEVTKLNKRVQINEKEVAKRKTIVDGIKKQSAKRKAEAIENKTVKSAKGNLRKAAIGDEVLKKAEADLEVAEKELDDERQVLQDQLHSGTVDPRLYYEKPGSNVRYLKDPSNRLKLRKPYESHMHREAAAKAYYDTIMNQTPEDTINQVMGRFTGNTAENPIKQRTLLIPDSVLYDSGFLTKDLGAKISNYVSYLDRRTHLKNVFKDITLDGGFEPIIEELNTEHEGYRSTFNERKSQLQEKLKDPNIIAKEKTAIEKNIDKVDKALVKRRKQFDSDKRDLNALYEKMMGIQKTSRTAQKIKAAVMSMTAWANLPFVPLTQLNDLSAIGLQHGMWNFIRDGMYPLVQSLGGILKTKDSEAFRKTAPSIHLAMQDVQMGYADRNWGSQTNPYLNMGKVVSSLQHIAHASSNFTLTNYIDNGLQHISASVFQSNLMRILHEFKAGTASKRDLRYIKKYGVDPDKWADRMIEAFKQDGGGKTKLGGYQSLFHKWQDIEAANQFGKAVFNSVKDTNINASIADAPLWLDDNGPIGIMGSFIRGFNGWGYASVNRYVIPSMQAPDAQKMIGVMFMLSTGYLIDPMRRMARGDTPFPVNVTDEQIMWSTINNSGYFSFFANVLADANLFTDDSLLGNLKNDKYKDRSRAGLLGPAWGTANRMADIVESTASGEWNKADAKKAARMIPFANASWTYWMSQKLIDSLNIPDTRRQAKALKGVS